MATTEQLTEIRDRWAKVTAGPWVRGRRFLDCIFPAGANDSHEHQIAEVSCWSSPLDQVESNTRAIAAAPTDIATLQAHIAYLESKLVEHTKNVTQKKEDGDHEQP